MVTNIFYTLLNTGHVGAMLRSSVYFPVFLIRITTVASFTSLRTSCPTAQYSLVQTLSSLIMLTT
jgi:hypothetical protein